MEGEANKASISRTAQHFYESESAAKRALKGGINKIRVCAVGQCVMFGFRKGKLHSRYGRSFVYVYSARIIFNHYVASVDRN